MSILVQVTNIEGSRGKMTSRTGRSIIKTNSIKNQNIKGKPGKDIKDIERSLKEQK